MFIPPLHLLYFKPQRVPYPRTLFTLASVAYMRLYIKPRDERYGRELYEQRRAEEEGRRRAAVEKGSAEVDEREISE